MGIHQNLHASPAAHEDGPTAYTTWPNSSGGSHKCINCGPSIYICAPMFSVNNMAHLISRSAYSWAKGSNMAPFDDLAWISHMWHVGTCAQRQIGVWMIRCMTAMYLALKELLTIRGIRDTQNRDCHPDISKIVKWLQILVWLISEVDKVYLWKADNSPWTFISKKITAEAHSKGLPWNQEGNT